MYMTDIIWAMLYGLYSIMYVTYDPYDMGHIIRFHTISYMSHMVQTI